MSHLLSPLIDRVMGYGPKSRKFKIFVKECSSDADVLVDLFETSMHEEFKWSIQPKNRNIVQFPAPERSNYHVDQLRIRLRSLLNDVDLKHFKSLVFDKFGKWPIELFILALWGAACSANTKSDVKIILRPSQLYIQNAKVILHALHSQGDDADWTMLDKKTIFVEQITHNLFNYFCPHCVDDVRKLGCWISYEREMLYIFGPYAKLKETEHIVNKYLTDIKILPVLTIDNLSQSDEALQSKICDLMKYKCVYCEFDVSGRLKIYGWTTYSVQEARKEIEIIMKPKATYVNSATGSGSKGSYSNVSPSQSVTSSRHSASSTKRRTFNTKEDIKVQVYEGNILEVDVDCIVNPADKDLLHRGGIAKEIAKRAGFQLKKDCDTYLGEYQQLDVGKACRTSAGKMKYKYVIHALGPRWKEYQPITRDSLKECGRLLRSAILESLNAANVASKTVRSIAFPAISAGKLGVPMEFCCVQYARAVIEYSKTAQSKMEIHFVDLRPEMIKMLIDTFDSMIYLDRPPSFYDEKVYIEKDLTGRSDGSKMHGARSDSNNMIYPDCKLMKPPYYFAEEFTCCLGPRQNIFVYIGDILSIPKVDMIVCGETVKGDNSGTLAKLLFDDCGQNYKTNKAKAFKWIKEGDVVFCATDKYRYIAHMCLIPKKKLDPKMRPMIIEDMFMKVFEGMKARNCRTLALPLIGTGQGHGDPEFYAERFIQSVIKFSANNKSVEFNIHLVNYENAKTDTAIRIIRSEVEKETKYSSTQLYKPTDSNHSHGRDGRKDNLPNSKNEAVQSSNHPKSARGRGNEHNPIPNKQRPKSSSASGAIRKSTFGDNNYNKAESDYGASKSSKAGKVKEKRKAANDAYNPNAYTTKNDELSDDELGFTNDDEKIQSKPPKGRTYNTQLSNSTRSLNSRSSPTTVLSSLSISVKSKSEEPKGGNLRIFDGETSAQDDNNDVDDNDDGDVDDVDSELDPNDGHSRGVSGAEYESMTIDSDHDDDGSYDRHRHSMDDDDEDQYGDDATKLSEAEDSLDDCVICMDTIDMKDLKKLQCGHKFHADCIEQQFVYKEACPTCGFVCGVITGDQPEGHMKFNINDNKSCTGYEGFGRIEITYSFPSGKQADYHPEPGKLYKGIQRTAYLPHNKQGRDILEMLRIAFDRKLIFTIGSSRTTGADSVITWNDIHHKTDHRPNTQFGYPDPTYLDRVTDELKAKGVTVDDIPTSKKHRRR